jgi:sporulation protein YlmC with PRC-barrel domain
MKKTALAAAACIFASSPLLSQEPPRSGDRSTSNVERTVAPRDTGGDRAGSLSESEFRDRMADAIQTVEGACASDISFFCAKVTPGEGRLALCMRAHEDQLGRACQVALYRAARNVARTAERIVDACWSEVRTLCGETGRIAQCVAQKKGSLSSSCEAIVTTLGQQIQELTARVGMPVYGPDGKNLGQIAEIVKDADGKVQSIQVDIGRLLGLGSKVVAINADKIESLSGIKVHLSEAEVRSLPEMKKQ